jgi:hypothetical protein
MIGSGAAVPDGVTRLGFARVRRAGSERRSRARRPGELVEISQGHGYCDARMATLFDPCTRTDSRPARHSEDMFSFLTRVDSPYWDAVRSLLEDWFAELPLDERDELSRRFRTGKYGEILSAFWQLYLHALLRRSDLTVTTHPSVPGSNRRPDFLAIDSNGDGLYLEAAVVIESNRAAARRRVLGQIFDQINAVPSPRFWLRVYLDAEAAVPPPAARLRPFLSGWLATLDYDQAVELATAKLFDKLPRIQWDSGGWRLRFMVLPKVPPDRGPTIGMYPSEGGAFDPRSEVLSTLKKKASRYGPLDRPYVIGVLCDNVVANDTDIEAALHGRMTVNFAEVGGEAFYWGAHRESDGLWTPRRGTRVSAVLTATELKPWTVPRVVPRLWTNPWAARELTVGLRWAAPASPTKTEAPAIGEPATTPREVLGLADPWPPGEPFGD